MEGERETVVLLVLALALAFMLSYSVHAVYPYEFIDPDAGQGVVAGFYPYPLHSDEWSHLSAGLAIAEEGRINFNPLTGEGMSDRELGFHLFLAGLFRILKFFMIQGVGLVYAYHLLASLMLVVNSFILFWIVSRFTQSNWIGLASIPFLVLVPSNANILGNWFFTPQTFSLALVFVYAFVFSEALESREGLAKQFALAGIIFLASIFIYPFAALLMALLSAGLMATRIGFIRKSWKSLLVLCGAMLVVSVLFIMLYFGDGSGLSSALRHFFSEISFEPGWTSIEYSYSAIGLYGMIPLLMALLGSVCLVWKRKGEPRLFFIWPVIHLAILLIYNLTGTSFFFPYQRNLFYLMVSLAPLAGMGLYWIAELAGRHSRVFFSRKNRKRQARMVAIGVVAILLILSFKSYYRIEPASFSLHKLITPENKEAFEWLDKNEAHYQTLMTSPFVSLVAYPLARMRVVGAMSASLEGGDFEAVMAFFGSSDCGEKEDLMREKGAGLVLSSENIECSFLKEIYSRKGIRIYKTYAVDAAVDAAEGVKR
ncbi:hypothetical protein JW711_03950 [Candidatus Woesearchaeota archaeon]|nr:hypothetical protein [Candidatus Woesearchaeota archaeon]